MSEECERCWRPAGEWSEGDGFCATGDTDELSVDAYDTWKDCAKAAGKRADEERESRLADCRVRDAAIVELRRERDVANASYDAQKELLVQAVERAEKAERERDEARERVAALEAAGFEPYAYPEDHVRRCRFCRKVVPEDGFPWTLQSHAGHGNHADGCPIKGGTADLDAAKRKTWDAAVAATKARASLANDNHQLADILSQPVPYPGDEGGK